MKKRGEINEGRDVQDKRETTEEGCEETRKNKIERNVKKMRRLCERTIVLALD